MTANPLGLIQPPDQPNPLIAGALRLSIDDRSFVLGLSGSQFTAAGNPIAPDTMGAGKWIQRGVHQKTWNGIGLNGVGSYLNAPGLPDKTVTVHGTFGTSGSIQLEGNDDLGLTWDILRDINGNQLKFTSNTTITIAENPLFIRPHVTAGDGTTSLTVVIISKG